MQTLERPQPLSRSHRKAFSLVEILTAIAIIAILASLLLVGLNHIKSSSKGKNTQVRLDTLRNMLSEFEHRGGRMQLIDDIYLPQQVKNNWTIGSRQQLPAGNVSEARGARTSDPAIKKTLDRTALVMHVLLSVPENKAMIDTMPAEATLKWQITLPNTAPGDPDVVVPILLDGWQNPIVFGPRRRPPQWTLSTAPDFTTKPKDKDLLWGVEGMVPPKTSFQSPDGKGTWVSAGAD